MPRITRSIPHQGARVLSAWEEFRPDKTYSAFTLEKFRAGLQLCASVREEIRTMKLQFAALLARRASVDRAAGKMTRRVVLAVRGDPDDGEDCPMYAAMGFVTRVQLPSRISRGRRRAKKARAKATRP